MFGVGGHRIGGIGLHYLPTGEFTGFLKHQQYLGGGFKHVLFSTLLAEMIQFDDHIFGMG